MEEVFSSAEAKASSACFWWLWASWQTLLYHSLGKGWCSENSAQEKFWAEFYLAPFFKSCNKEPLSVKNAVRQKTVPGKPWALILLDLLISLEGTQLWHLTLAWLSFTAFLAPLVADMVYQSYMGLAYPPGLPLSPRGS